MKNGDANKSEEPWYEKCTRLYVDITLGRWNPITRLSKWLGGCLFSGAEKILFLLGDTNSGKTEMMCLLSDSQYAPFFWGVQHHAVDKTITAQEEVLQLGCAYVVTNDGAGVEDAKRSRMTQVEIGLDRYLNHQSRKFFEAKNYLIPIYVIFTFNMSVDTWDMEGASAELRLFKEKVFGRKYFYIEGNKATKDKPHVANFANEGENGKEFQLVPKFIVVGTHADSIKSEWRDECTRRFKGAMTDVMEKEFGGNASLSVMVADIRSMNGRQVFMKEFNKCMEVFHG